MCQKPRALHVPEETRPEPGALVRAFCRERGLEFHAISAVTGEGVQELVRAMADALERIPPRNFGAPESQESGENAEGSTGWGGVPQGGTAPAPAKHR